MNGSVVIAGSIAQRPGYGGHTWALLQWVLGFRALGWSVLFLDRLDDAMCGTHGIAAMLDSMEVAHFTDTMRRFGLDCDSSLELRACDRRLRVGLADSDVRDRVAAADFVIDIMGFLSDPELLSLAPRRVFLDIDPGFGQMWAALGLSDPFTGYDDHITIGLNIGRPECRIPTCGIDWITTPPPIALEHWPATRVPVAGAITTIGSWRGPYGPVEYDGESFGLRVHEFRRFIDLPARAGMRFEAALEIDAADHADRERLRKAGWQLLDPQSVAWDADAYAALLRGSAAELMIAKNMYVRSRSGWFSDRSIAFMASGRPVLAQDTGLTDLPAGIGLLLFDDPENAVAGVESIATAPARHGRAARELADAHFDARVVLPALADRLGSRRSSTETTACA